MIVKDSTKLILKCYCRRLQYQRNVKMSKVVNLFCTDADVASVSLAVDSLKSGKIIAVPTDTIYGIAGLAQSKNAINQIYDIKNRDSRNPISICVAGVSDINRWGKVTVSNDVLSDLLPGPVTVVFERTAELNPDLNSFTSLVGIRVPDHSFVQALVAACREPLALTSANISSTQSTLAVQEFKCLWPRLDMVFDGGVLGDTLHSRQGSTVVDLSTSGKFMILRPGSAKDRTVEILKEKYGLEETLKH